MSRYLFLRQMDSQRHIRPRLSLATRDGELCQTNPEIESYKGDDFTSHVEAWAWLAVFFWAVFWLFKLFLVIEN